MKMKLVALLVATLAVSSFAQAPVSQGRIAVSGSMALSPDKAVGDGGSIMNATWENDPAKVKRYVTAIFPAGPEWKRSLMTFTPEKDGTVTLQLMGAWNKDGKQTWTLFDDIKVEGAEIKNGSFEDGSANWALPEREGKTASLSDVSMDGTKSMKVAHDFNAAQNMTVKAGQPVTIAFWFKAAE